MKNKKIKPVCVRIINENIKAVENNEPLTMPLKELKTDCRFLKFYHDFCNIKYGSMYAERKKAYYEANKDKLKAYRKANKKKIAEHNRQRYLRLKEKNGK